LFGTSLEKTGNTVSAESAYMQALAADPASRLHLVTGSDLLPGWDAP
jgi:Flp pilus assembly protein TadD